MGGSQSSEKKTEILNDTNVQVAMKNVNESLNNMTMSIVQDNLVQTAAGATITQNISISGITASKDITISGVSQKAGVQISLSSLVNTELKQELVTNTMNQMKSALSESMGASQESAKSEQEQIISAAMGALSSSLSSLTGTDTDSKEETSIKNLLNIESDTELQNIIEQNISTELVNKTITQISNKLVGDQAIEIENITSEEGAIVISEISQEFLSEQMLEAVQESGSSTEIIAAIGNISAADVEKAVSAGQSASQEEVGTLQGIGGVVDSVGQAWTGFVSAMGANVIIPILLVGGLVLFMFRGVISNVAAKKAGVKMPQQPMPRIPRIPIPQQFRQPMRGGSKKIKSGIKKLTKMMKTLSIKISKFGKRLLKQIKNHPPLHILIAVVVIIILIVVVYKMLMRESHEGFTNESKTSNIIISSNSKFLRNKKIGDNHLCLTEDKTKAYQFEMSILEDKYIYIYKIIGKDKYYMKMEDKDVILEKYNFIKDSKYKFSFEKTGDNLYKLFQKTKYISVKDDCLEITEKKEEAAELLFE